MTLSGRPSRNRSPELALVGAQRLEPAERVEVGDRRGEAGEQLVGRRAGLEPAADRGRRRRARLVRAPGLEQVVPSVGEAQVRPAELVRRAEEHVAADRLRRRPARAPRSGRRRPRRARRRSRASSATRCASVIVPTAFEAQTKATTRTRSSSFRSRSSRSSRRSSVTSIQSTSKPRSAASSTHGATPPSWSRRVTRIRSPSASRATRSARARSRASSCCRRRRRRRPSSRGSARRRRAAPSRISSTRSPVS